MTETKTRTRKANPYTRFAKAKEQADRVRRAAARADELAAAAKAAAEKAQALKAKQVDVELEEQEAYAELQAALKALEAVEAGASE